MSRMQSLLLVSEDKKKREGYLKNLYKEFKINNFDIYTVESEKSIGIEEIRIFQKKIFLKPIKSLNKTVVVNNAQTLTIEAQNALLKVLEEPPANTVIILNTNNENALLPTILSRCKIIKLKVDLKTLEEKEKKEVLYLLDLLFLNEVGAKLKLAQDISKTKEETIFQLEKMVLVLREKLLERTSEKDESKPSIAQLFYCFIALNKTYVIIKTTNVNPRLALENLFLSLTIESTIPVCQFNSKPGLES